LNHLEKDLLKRKENGNHRSLPLPSFGIDFLSNDYLGLASKKHKLHVNSGSSGSRLLSGNSKSTEAIEERIAKIHGVESALLFQSGYTANLGLISAVVKKNDYLIADEFSHASILDGARMSFGSSYKFKHNDLEDLEKKLLKASGSNFVITESTFSMDGSSSNLKEVSKLCKAHKALLIVDEAHSVGLENEYSNMYADIRVVTYGKAFGAHGAAVLGPAVLKQFLVNFSRPFIYSTAPSPCQIESINMAYSAVLAADNQRFNLEKLIEYWNKSKDTSLNWIESKTQIQSLVIPGNLEVSKLCEFLSQNGVNALPIKSPTVKAGFERVRFCLHSFNTKEQIDLLFKLLDQWEGK